jgi:hypothetical protein
MRWLIMWQIYDYSETCFSDHLYNETLCSCDHLLSPPSLLTLTILSLPNVTTSIMSPFWSELCVVTLGMFHCISVLPWGSGISLPRRLSTCHSWPTAIIGKSKGITVSKYRGNGFKYYKMFMHPIIIIHTHIKIAGHVIGKWKKYWSRLILYKTI